ncbi:lantibiotic dehydratase, partial [Streptomyces sp. T-3]|nr:lantibiotic dehydratase [Streptomyces sp. T-3]
MASTPRGSGLATVDAEDPVAGARRLADDPVLRQAVEVASGSLALSLRELSSEDGVAQLGRKRTLSAARTLTRYARRSAGRPTPFGLFAGVATARFGPQATTGGSAAGEVAVRLDGGWLHRRVLAWLAEPAVRRRVDVVLNNLCVLRDGRLLLRTGERETSVRDSALVAAVRELAAAPLPYPQLLDALRTRFASLTAERLDGQLGGLIQHGFLLTSLTPHRIDDALLDRIETAVEGAWPQQAKQVRAVREAAAAHAADPPGEGLD